MEPGAADELEALFAQAEIRWDDAGPRAALAVLLPALEAFPDEADLHYAVGTAYEELEQARLAGEHFERVASLDAAWDDAHGLGSEDDLDRIEHTAVAALANLPPRFRDPLDDVAVLLMPRPPLYMVREGFDPRAFGLFEGPNLLAPDDVVDLPPRIILFANNLLAAYPEADALCREVEVTVLHEVAHYLGYEEEDMHGLGLE